MGENVIINYLPELVQIQMVKSSLWAMARYRIPWYPDTHIYVKFQLEGASAKVKEMISSNLQVFQYLPSLHCKPTGANVKVLKGWRCINIQKWNSLLRNSCQNIGPESWISFPLQKIDNVDFPAPLNQDYLALPSTIISHFHRSQNFLNLCNIFFQLIKWSRGVWICGWKKWICGYKGWAVLQRTFQDWTRQCIPLLDRRTHKTLQLIASQNMRAPARCVFKILCENVSLAFIVWYMIQVTPGSIKILKISCNYLMATIEVRLNCSKPCIAMIPHKKGSQKITFIPWSFSSFWGCPGEVRE